MYNFRLKYISKCFIKMLQCICKLCNALWMLQCTCLWCNAMDDFTSTHKSQERKWGLQPHCYISMCVVVPVLTTPIQLRFLHMHLQYESAKVWLQCMKFIHLQKFTTPRAMPQVDKHTNPPIKQDSDLIWLVWPSEI